ncbi:MAG: MotA/TolQ/ExbB proton channel family protein [Acidobacteria bacterium]|nr:MotA/TolQ/ExbB proton channel family protein [Acidobacteriota bacterium]
MNYVNQFLNFISDGLLLPAVTLEILLLFSALWAGGLFARDLWQRLRGAGAVGEFIQLAPLDQDWATAIRKLPVSRFREVVQSLLDTSHDRRLAMYRLNLFENECQKELDQARMLTRLGPILGLMGTLIPKGHALGQLALGDVSAMTQNLQVAFANTVVGLFIGAVGFVIQQGRQRWYKQELDALDYLYDLLFEEKR